MIRVGDAARIIEQKYPLHFSFSWDNCDLQAGSLDQKVRAILVALDPTTDAVLKAARSGAGLLVTHHPLFHEPLRRIDRGSAVGSAASEALASSISVYSAHTNLDAAPEGLAWELARRGGCSRIGSFGSVSSEKIFKLVVFVPEASAEKVRREVSAAGAGTIGRYDSCAFLSSGAGVFRPLRGARPSTGRRGRLERVGEVRLETRVTERCRDRVVEALKAAHPYEEPAFDLLPVETPPQGGAGAIGEVPRESLAGFAARLASIFGAEARISGGLRSKVKRVAFVPGSGGGYVEEAARLKAQVLVTGEVRYHQVIEAEHHGLAVIELGHDRSEMPAVDLLAGALRRGPAKISKKTKVHTYRRPARTRTVSNR